MKILFDINHPAQFHLFRNFYFYLKRQNHQVVVSIRNRDFTKTLCDLYGIDYLITSEAKNGFIGFASEFIKKEINLINLQRKWKFDIGFGTSLFLSHLSFLFKFRDYNFIEDDDEWVTFHRLTAYPFAYRIVVPQNLKYKHWHDKRIKHNSYHELAYLHPNNFEPDKSVLEKYDLSPKQYVVTRFSALNAYHDYNIKGISKQLYTQIKEMLNNYKIIESVENSKSHQINPMDMHSVLFYSKILISDSQTMTMEATVLGVPSIRVNSHVGKIAVLDDELMNKYQLTFGYLPENQNNALIKLDELISNKELEEDWSKKRNIMLAEKDDLNQWMIEQFENNWKF